MTSGCRSWSGGDGGQVGVPRPQQRLELQVGFFQIIIHQHLHHTTGQQAEHDLRPAVGLSGAPSGSQKGFLTRLRPDHAAVPTLLKLPSAVPYSISARALASRVSRSRGLSVALHKHHRNMSHDSQRLAEFY